ncbi:MAG: AAA family ATPase [Marivibrio sp.]|uniref:AAA family ATPase n=1 Tax=Marivibrio sp. TaxID=2039719 RepID=UPI0032EB31D4
MAVVTGPLLIALSGPPGVGKSCAADALALCTGAVVVRVDAIEAGLRRHDPALADTPAGYLVGYALAADHLDRKAVVIADCVNPLPETRAAWRAVAAEAGARFLAVELRCGDEALWRERVEARREAAGAARAPSWEQARARRTPPWPEADLRLDTARRAPLSVAESILAALG